MDEGNGDDAGGVTVVETDGLAPSLAHPATRIPVKAITASVIMMVFFITKYNEKNRLWLVHRKILVI